MNACLLHHDYHEFSSACHERRIMWELVHDQEPGDWREELYQMAVESAILNDMWKVGKWAP